MTTTVDKHKTTFEEIMRVFRERYAQGFDRFLVLPPVFLEMDGEFTGMDVDRGSLRARFPIQERFLNPYKVLQGGIIAVAVDNTLGPLSMLIAPPNFTRHMEVKYSQPAKLDDGYLEVEGKLVSKEGRRLNFTADVRNPSGQLLARARAMHWIIEE